MDTTIVHEYPLHVDRLGNVPVMIVCCPSNVRHGYFNPFIVDREGKMLTIWHTGPIGTVRAHWSLFHTVNGNVE
jgi:hypothetical protein